MKNGVCVNYVCALHRNFSIITPSVEGSSVLRAPRRAAEVGAAGRMAAAAVVGGWGDHAAVSSLAADLVYKFTLGIGHWNASLSKKRQQQQKITVKF